jgi:hypothetical protein
MSTSGHYTRYINQYPKWSDNCDTMYQGIYSPLLLKKCGEKCIPADCSILKNGKKEKYCQENIGYFTIEHNHGNTWSWCTFSHDHSYGEKPRYPEINNMGIYEYTGKKAIQNVLEFMEKFTFDQLIDMVLKYQFNNRSYLDYLNEV